MRARKALLVGALGLIVALGAAGAVLMGIGRNAGDEQGFLAGLVSRALSTSTSRVHIGAVDGALSSNATIRDVVISDRDGAWLKLDRAHIKWRRAALLLRRLEIDELEIGHLEVRRKPLPSDAPVKADKPLLPDLPVKVEIKQFALADLDLGKDILGVAMRAAATGDTALGSPAEGLAFHLDGKRLDSPGRFFAALTFRPADKALSVKIKLDEPAAGLVSKLAHLPNEPPVTLDLAGDGTLDAFDGRIAFAAGPTIDAKGTVTLRREGSGRILATRVAGHLGPMLPALAAPVFAGATSLSSDVRFDDDGAVHLPDVTLASHLARLEAHGALSTDRVMDFAATIRAVPNSGETSAVGAGSIRKLVFDSTVQGAITAPRIAVRLSLADARLPQGALQRLEARFAATPSGEVTDLSTRITLDGAIEASGIAPRDPTLARAIGDSATLSLHGTSDMQGNAHVDRIEAKTPTASLAFSGDVGARLNGRLITEAPDLSRFGALVGSTLTGKAGLVVSIDGATNDARLVLDGRANAFTTGIGAIDGLVGRSPTLSGRVAKAGDTYRIEALTLGGAHIALRSAGTAAPESADLTATVEAADLSRADPRLNGHARIVTHLTGGLNRPSVALTAALDDAKAVGRPIPHLALDVAAQDLRANPSLRARLDGQIDRRPATGTMFAHGDGKGWMLETLDLAVGSVKLDGKGAVDAAHRVDGRIRIAAGDLDDLSALALTKLKGAFTLDAAFTAPDGHQNAHVAAHGADLAAAGSAVHRFDLRADAQDIFDKPVLDAEATVDRVQVGGQTISGIRFSAKGEGVTSALKLSARAVGFDLDAGGTLVASPQIRFDLNAFSARRGSRKIALDGPAQFALGDGGVDIHRLALGIGGGRLTVDGHAGKTLHLAVDAKTIPLAAADIVMPGLGLAGTLDANAKVAGPLAAPVGSYAINLRKVGAPQTRSTGVPPIDVGVDGRLDGRRASVSARIAAGRAGSLTASGSLPLDPAGAFDLAVHGRLDASVANATRGPSGRTVSGAVLVDAKLAGTRAAPKISGGATMSGGTFRDTLIGARLDDIGFKIVAQGDRLSLERLGAATPGGGTLSGSGQVKIDPAAGFPGSLSIRGSKAQLASSSLMTATANLAIDISGALARNPRIGGRVDLTHVDVGIPDRLPATLKPIDGVKHVNAPRHAAERLALSEKKTRGARGTKGRAAMFDALLDVKVAAPNRIFVRGRGVDAELGGDLHVTGSTEHPTPNGAFALRTGKLAALGKTMTFKKGNLTFTGDLMPEVDLAAEIAATGVTAQIAVTGPATAPAFAFTSSPSLPPDEVLSRVLFDKPSGNLSGVQALQLAQAAAQFSDGGDGALEKLRKSLGVDSLDVGSSSSGSPSVGVSRAISERVRVGVSTGATPDQTGLSADVDVTRHVRVQSQVQQNGSTSMGVGTELEY